MANTEKEKISIKFGNLEFTYEGKGEFIENGFFELVKKTADLFKVDQIPITANDSSGSVIGSDLESIDSYAQKLGVASGPDLVIVAAAFLTFTKKQSQFSRNELIGAMKSATSYYKDSYLSNLTSYIKSLVKKSRFLTQGSNYSLSQDEKKSVGAKLG